MEFETYADVIDAYERDNMGYDTLTDYINKQNIKIKEIDMDPLGDLERIINSKAYGGGVGHLLEPTQTYHQYHDFTAPMTVGAMVDNKYNRGGRVSYAQGGSRRSKYDSTGGSLASSSKSKNISPGPGGGRDDEPKGPPKIINPPLPKDKSTELFTFDEYTGKPMTYADVAAANNFLNFVKTQGGYKMGEDTEADALYEAYRTATGKDTYMQDATVDAITNQRVSQIDDGDYKAFFDHTGTITDNPTGRMSKSLMVQTPTSFTHRFTTPSGIIENDIAQPFGAPQSLSVDPYSNNIIGSDLRAEVTQQDIDRKRQMKNLDFNTAKDIGVASPGLTEFEFEGIKSGEITEPGTYVGADGGRVGLFMGGDPLTGQALSIYESMNSYGFSDAEIASALQQQGLYTPPGSGTPTPDPTPDPTPGQGGGQGGGDSQRQVNLGLGFEGTPTRVNPKYYYESPSTVPGSSKQYADDQLPLSAEAQKIKESYSSQIDQPLSDAAQKKKDFFAQQIDQPLSPEAQKMKEFYESKGVNLPNEWGIYRNPNPGLAEEIFGKYTGSNYPYYRQQGAIGNYLDKGIGVFPFLTKFGKGAGNIFSGIFGKQNQPQLGTLTGDARWAVEGPMSHGNLGNRDAFGVYTGGKTLLGKTANYEERLRNLLEEKFGQDSMIGDVTMKEYIAKNPNSWHARQLAHINKVLAIKDEERALAKKPIFDIETIEGDKFKGTKQQQQTISQRGREGGSGGRMVDRRTGAMKGYEKGAGGGKDAPSQHFYIKDGGIAQYAPKKKGIASMFTRRR